MPLNSQSLVRIRGFTHAFGDIKEPLPAGFKPHWEKSKPQWKQVHGNSVAEVTQPNQACGEVDALFTYQRSLPIAVVTADCVPVILARKDGKAAAVIHAGWRGTQARIVRSLWKILREKEEAPENWTAAIGPSIGPCCYEVSEELAQKFETDFGFFGKGLAVPTHRHLDLPAINAEELRALGITEIDLIRACTRCRTTQSGDPVFHSFRREGGGTRQYAVAMLL